jgi:uncharacterized protein YfiM (DUF2279 family)
VQGQDSLKIAEADSIKIINPKITISDSWFGIDKGQHFTGSLIGTILISQVNNRYFDINKSNSKTIGTGIVFSIGITKELFDSKKDKNIFSWKDLVANVAGIITGVVIMEIK